jgi:membrane protease YdiL (CAAX protease family)
MLVLAPVMEEIWFRGWMYRAVRAHFSAQFAIVASAVLFAVAHMSEGNPLPVSQLIGGLVFAYAFERTGGIWVPAILHMLGNGSLIAASILLRTGG